MVETATYLTTTRFASFNWYIQIVYNSMLFLFYSEFLDLKLNHPTFYRFIMKYVPLQLSISSLLWMYCVITHNNLLYHSFFNFLFLPVSTIVLLYGLYIAFSIPKKLGHFIIIGIVLYYGFAMLAYLRSSDNNFEEVPIKYFYIAIILESFVFLLGLGYKIKLVYFEKINTQEAIIKEQKKLQLLRENSQIELKEKLREQEVKLREALAKTENEKLKSLQLKYENEISKLKLESLRNQMNPHFIFNALNSIKAFLVTNDKVQASHYLGKFSKLIRKILESSRNEVITLAEELEILELYMNIENIRLEPQISIDIINKESKMHRGIKLPALILQPFVENAIWHGLMLIKNNRKLTVELTDEVGIPCIIITDNGIGRKKAAAHQKEKSIKKESLGLVFIQERLDYFNQKQQTQYHFEIKDVEEGWGTRVVFYFE
jgi:sensor histidine kinase YesM